MGILKWLRNNKRQVIRFVFVLPILFAVIVSIAHVITWYKMGNPDMWAIYMSIAIEIGALASLAAASVGIRGFGVWVVFGLVTFIQFIGNMFFSYQFIDETSALFNAWIEMTSPIFELAGTEVGNVVAHKRWLALLIGGFVPMISLASLHFFMKYSASEDSSIELDNLLDDLEDDMKSQSKAIEESEDAIAKLKKEVEKDILAEEKAKAPQEPKEQVVPKDEFDRMDVSKVLDGEEESETLLPLNEDHIEEGDVDKSTSPAKKPKNRKERPIIVTKRPSPERIKLEDVKKTVGRGFTKEIPNRKK